ncbi:hypothetical protein [Oceaniglobus indicus]|uniref:hypothetical protein n=1 Tax=Oceaniglobus indicus TaxID=2047749 RepID=UPI0011AB40D2|nr:hypothetical protein [Oceaniglobus indicus]
MRGYASDLIPERITQPEGLDQSAHPENYYPETALSVISRFEKLGAPQERYRERGGFKTPYDLQKFDALCFILRRLCVPLEEISDGKTWRQHLSDNSKIQSRFSFYEQHARQLPLLFNPLFEANYEIRSDPPTDYSLQVTGWTHSAFLFSNVNDRNFLDALEWIIDNSDTKERDVEHFLKGFMQLRQMPENLPATPHGVFPKQP